MPMLTSLYGISYWGTELLAAHYRNFILLSIVMMKSGPDHPVPFFCVSDFDVLKNCRAEKMEPGGLASISPGNPLAPIVSSD
jgi:hypothetical protein